MEAKIKRNIVDKILKRIPTEVNAIDYLAALLQISKESVYRRIKGEVPFTFEDIIKLSSELQFSIDELAFSDESELQQTKNGVFDFQTTQIHDAKDTFVKIFTTYIKTMQDFLNSSIAEVSTAANHPTLLPLANYDHLFNFYYYKWTYQLNVMPFNFKLSDITIPDEVRALQDKVKSFGLFVTNNTYVLDRDFIKSLLKEVRYYYERKLISPDELQLIQKDVYQFIDAMEIMATDSVQKLGYRNDMYLSSMSIEATGLLYKTDTYEEVQLWLYSGAYIRTRDKDVCKVYKVWLMSLRRYSSLITDCNESLRMEFLDQQREYVKNLANEDYSYEKH